MSFSEPPSVSKERALILIKTNVINEGDKDKEINIKQLLKDQSGKIVATHFSKSENIVKGKDIEISQEFTITKPMLWYPDTPSLYTLETSILEGKKVIDVLKTKSRHPEIGI